MSEVRRIMAGSSMMNEETRRKLRELNLEEMVAALDIQSNDTRYAALPFDDRMKRLVDHVYQEKYTSKVKRLMKGARFHIPAADVHEIYYVDRHVDSKLGDRKRWPLPSF